MDKKTLHKKWYFRLLQVIFLGFYHSQEKWVFFKNGLAVLFIP